MAKCDEDDMKRKITFNSANDNFDFKFFKSDGQNTWEFHAYVEEGLLIQILIKNSMTHGFDLTDGRYCQGQYAIREHDTHGLQIFDNGWCTPCEEMGKAYSDWKAEQDIL